MTLIYHQRDGATIRDGHFEGCTYSGFGEGRNNPDMESVASVGPIPHGKYRISLCDPSEHPHLHPPVLRFTPIGHDAHGRSGFLGHGDNKDHTASRGCIIWGRSLRKAIAADLLIGHDLLEVI